MKIALISDTHIPTVIPGLPHHLIERLHDTDLILHAGDFVRLDVLETLQGIAETAAVYGNADEPAICHRLPRKQLLTFAGNTIGLIHGNQPPEIERAYLKPDYTYNSPPVSAFYEFLLSELPEADVIVFGHLNVPVIRHEQDRLLVNPGSVAPYQEHSSFGILHLDADKVDVELVEL
jgi:putative phosphoesterase